MILLSSRDSDSDVGDYHGPGGGLASTSGGGTLTSTESMERAIHIHRRRKLK